MDKSELSTIIADLLKKRPVLHHITNYVTAESCADMALAVGAAPVMAEDAREMTEITAGADALVLNLGMISEPKMQAMQAALQAARAKKIPVVLDPVGVMSSKLRLEFALKLLKTGGVTIVRGNLSECRALLEQKTGGRGVDALTEETPEAMKVAKEAAAKYRCVFGVTGATDYVSDGKRAVMLNGGSELLTQITGAGCMTTTLVAACAAVAQDRLEACALGIVLIGQGAELAAGFMEKKDGPGMFKTRLFDGVFHVVNQWSALNLEPKKVN